MLGIPNQQFGVDQRVGIRQFFRQVMVVCDNHIHPLRVRVLDRFMCAYAGIAGQHQLDPLPDQTFQDWQVDPVRFAVSHRDMIAHLSAKTF